MNIRSSCWPHLWILSLPLAMITWISTRLFHISIHIFGSPSMPWMIRTFYLILINFCRLKIASVHQTICAVEQRNQRTVPPHSIYVLLLTVGRKLKGQLRQMIRAVGLFGLFFSFTEVKLSTFQCLSLEIVFYILYLLFILWH